MQWLSVICAPFLLILGAFPALIRNSHQVQRRALSNPAAGPRAPVWTAHAQAGLSLGAWVRHQPSLQTHIAN